MRKILHLCLFPVAVVAVAAAASAYQDSVAFAPLNPTGHTSVDAVASGWWRDPCLPSNAGATISGSTITLHMSLPPFTGAPPCPPMLAQYSMPFHLGVLAPGTYAVVSVAEEGGKATELARTAMVVREDESLQIVPYAVPITGGQIGIANPFYLAGATVTIGEKTVTANSSVDGMLFADAPAHAPGAVDVVVNSTNGQTRSAKAGVIYYDPAAADPAVFEPILFPLSFEGPGAFGSQWTTESFIEGSGSPAYFRDALPCQGCSGMLSTGLATLVNDGAPYGHVLYAMRGTTAGLTFASRIRDTSRQAQTAGTEVPVVRESDFRARPLRFLNVPASARYRTMLRVWVVGDAHELVAIPDSIPAQIVRVPMTKIGTTLSFGSADLTAALQQSGSSTSRLQVYDPASTRFPPPAWGMLSITNNETQQVTIVTP